VRSSTACLIGVLSSALLAQAASPDVGLFPASGDVGSPKIGGSAAYNPISEDYALSAAGSNMWAQRDEFQFVSRRLTGDFILQARVQFAGKGVDPHRKAGLVIRAGTDADAPYVDAVVHGDGLTSLQFRRTKGAATEEKRSEITGADVLQLERRGSRFIMSAAKSGDPYTTTELADMTLPDEVLAGLALCSHNPDVVERAVFSNVRVIRPAAENFRPYRDYIGSVLELLDVSTGARRVLQRSEDPFEAPNWTRDGGSLIYNTSGTAPDKRGRLVRYDLASGHTTTIDTATNTRNNNDHVLSFDGTMLAISDQSQPGGSAVYTMPLAGGTPKRLTANTPSYGHSWSPDGKTILYTGGRGTDTPEFDIFAMNADGTGAERNLTHNKGLDDGPEYAPDGKSIYFNSVRSGSMQIWRMKPDGSDPEQVTNDARNNWFPHISPDGQWIAFISFPKEVDPADHPYYKQVMLRVMPVAGGAPRTIAYVYGGQGTINVPSWSPDSRMLAFVSNSGSLK